MKLKKCLVILPLLALTLTGCEGASSDSSTSTSSSEEETSSEVTTLSNYTLSIEFIYAEEVESVPEYADAYITGSFNNWTFEALTENESRYEITFATIKAGTYEYQVCLGYDAETAGSYSYRITQSNETFTITGEEGDGYVNKVSLTASNTLDSIIPDPSSVIKNVKVKFNVVYNESPESVLSYATLRVAGTFSNWGFVECSIEEGYYVYTFDELMPIQYEYWVSIYYTGETPSDYNTYKVNGANETFTIAEGTEDGATIEATITATDSLANILPEPSEGGSSEEKVVSNFTISVTFTDATTGTTALAVPEGDTVYFAGSFDVDEWSQWVTSTDYKLTLDESKSGTYVYTYTFSQITTGEYEIEFLFCETGTVDWGHSLGKTTFTVTSDNQDYLITHQTNYDDLNTVIQAIGADTNFYVLYVDSGSTSVDSISTNVAAANWGCGVNSPAEGASITYNGSGATATTASNSKTVIYSSSYFTASSHANVWCTLYSGSWNPQSGTNGIEVPENATGTYAVYIGEVTLTNWASNSGTQNVWNNSGKWVTGVDSIETVINNLGSYYTI
ncbi:MAG: hypothetical protein LUD22_04245 [Coprobacillus sp.]|nr:hypothetical protein [Coprobacillus sp.]